MGRAPVPGRGGLVGTFALFGTSALAVGDGAVSPCDAGGEGACVELPDAGSSRPGSALALGGAGAGAGAEMGALGSRPTPGSGGGGGSSGLSLAHKKAPAAIVATAPMIARVG